MPGKHRQRPKENLWHKNGGGLWRKIQLQTLTAAEPAVREMTRFSPVSLLRMVSRICLEVRACMAAAGPNTMGIEKAVGSGKVSVGQQLF